ncbi:MAG: hypothetical protein BYD32DRAFT_465773 [Podila humilis]|nr:MAG: hypothetical protein BYD32DRAFT_465773 [Podila humilis]
MEEIKKPRLRIILYDHTSDFASILLQEPSQAPSQEPATRTNSSRQKHQQDHHSPPVKNDSQELSQDGPHIALRTYLCPASATPTHKLKRLKIQDMKGHENYLLMPFLESRSETLADLEISGNSSIFFSQRAKVVLACRDDLAPPTTRLDQPIRLQCTDYLRFLFIGGCHEISSFSLQSILCTARIAACK